MSSSNNQGLSRNIPADVRRTVRRQTGFGCVHCGCAIITYEHYDPEFTLATEHNPKGMTLLCGTCQLRKTKGLLSVETIRADVQNPATFRQGFAKGLFDESTVLPIIRLGSLVFEGGTSILKVNGKTILGFNDPEEQGAPLRLIAQFVDQSGEARFVIDGNEFFINPHNWDTVSEGRSIVVKGDGASQLLELQHIPREALVLTTVHMYYGPYELLANERGAQLKLHGKNVLCMGSSRISGPALFDINQANISMRDIKVEGINKPRFDMTPDAVL